VEFLKLDRRHNLYHKGYRYAFRADRWQVDTNKIERAVKELEGHRWDMTFWGKPKDGARPYYIGVRNESTATMALLKM
jgi:hypothetical protein